jgi:hypothetical protein
MSPKKWMRKTLRWCQKVLTQRNISVSPSTIRKALGHLNISLKKNQKYVNTRNHPDRDKQFQYIQEIRAKFIAAGNPVISVDTKKKELIGNFQNKGRIWCKNAKKVLDHDFPSAAKGKLVPYGIYDLQLNRGYVHCGISADTPEFAVESIIWWWQNFGKKNYPNAQKILILCDSGGSNGYRPRKWKMDLQTNLTDKMGLSISVSHYPSGTYCN